MRATRQPWRPVLLAGAAAAAALLGVLIAVLGSGAPSPALAAAVTTGDTTVLAPAPGQPDPTNLWDSTPIPAVVAAVRAAQDKAPLPTTYSPSLTQVEDNQTPPAYNPACAPVFGTGIKPRGVCFLGDPSSPNRVVIIGDSHAGRWVPALEKIGEQDDLAIVPLGKAGCQINVYNTNRPNWPCLSWYRWALAEDHKIDPVATLVSFLLKTNLENATTVSRLETVLGQVTRGVYLADPPYQTQFPVTCLSTAGATMGTCSARVPRSYTPFMKAMAKMTAATGHPAIPTLQWFCADGICPMLINDTLTTGDRSHLTVDYSSSLSDVLGLTLAPILTRYERQIDAGEQFTITTSSSAPTATTSRR